MAPAVREMARTVPAEDSSRQAKEALMNATGKRLDSLGVTAPEARNLAVVESVPSDFKELTQAPMKYGSYGQLGLPDGTVVGGQININPNAARDILAHEMGHHITANTGIGGHLQNLRTNPKLAMALSGGVIGLPFVQAALQEGDDDVASGLAIAALASSPTLVNEALATKNGLAILEEAGMKATPGQRARMAGALMSYAAVPILAGLTGTAVGNFADDYTAVYDL